MKKVLISMIAIFLCILLTSCGSEIQAYTNVSKSLERASSTISLIEKQETDMNTALTNQTEGAKNVHQLRKNRNHTKLQMIDSTYTKASDKFNNLNSAGDCIYLQASIKSCIQEIKSKINDIGLKIKDRKEITSVQVKALNELAQNVSLNCSRLNMGKAETRKELNDINKELKRNTQTELLDAKITKLSNCLDTRLSGFENILSSLNNINTIIIITVRFVNFSFMIPAMRFLLLVCKKPLIVYFEDFIAKKNFVY